MPIPLPIIGGVTAAGTFLKWLAGQSANEDATNKGLEALNQAQGAIQTAADKGIALQQPYLQHAGEDYARQRGLVQSGYFQTPYGQSFQPQQYAPSGFTMNPAQGMASFNPQSFQMNSFTPQGLPPMPNLPAYQPPPQTPQGPPLSTQPKIPTFQDQVHQTQPNVPVSPQGGLVGPPIFNPQTGQNSPLGQFKPGDPRMPTVQDLVKILLQRRPGQSGPYGMQRGGLL